MNSDRNNKKLDELISETISREKPHLDLDKWKEKHQKEIQIYKSQENSEKKPLATFEPNIWRIMSWRKVGYLAAAFLLICSLVACFLLSRKVGNLRKEQV